MRCSTYERIAQNGKLESNESCGRGLCNVQVTAHTSVLRKKDTTAEQFQAGGVQQSQSAPSRNLKEPVSRGL